MTPARFVMISLLSLATLCSPAFAQVSTLSQVQERGYLRCGVNPGQMGMSMADADGQWQGMSTDLCRALAAATLGDADAVDFVPITVGNRFPALRSGRIDVILRSTTWTFSRDVRERVQFVGPYFVDEAVVMVRAGSEITELAMLDEYTVCVVAGGPAEVFLRDLASSADARIFIVPVESAEQYRQAYEESRCVGIADGRAALQAMRIALADPDQHVFLEPSLALSPLSIGVREGDHQWADIVRWTFYALATAESVNITGEDVADITRTTNDPALLRMLGPVNGTGAQLGLADDWAVHAIEAAGNLAEIYDRAFGPDSALPIPRGRSALWRDGGMILLPPF